jgi:hypothetical protein
MICKIGLTSRRNQRPLAVAVPLSRFTSLVGRGSAFIVRLLDAHFMKTSLVVVLAFILVGCESSRQSASLTTQQATTTAMRLANDKASTLYQHQPFVAGQSAQFVAGHWLWVARQGFGRGDIQATVELAADGSTNNVDLQLFDSQNTFRGF